ncbi:CapA family protein [Nakamurella alba]|nr:CapA family protein [Nakamurella alba]
MRLVIVGDTVVARTPAQPATFSAATALSALPLLHDGDVTIANLEVPLADTDSPTEKEMTVRAPTATAPVLAALGVDVVSLATNHALDHGVDGLLSTIDALDAAGVRHAGAGRTLAEADTGTVVRTEDGRTLAVLSVCSTLPAGANATAARPGIAPIRIDQSLAIDGGTMLEQPGTPPYLRTRAQEADVVRVEDRIRRVKQQVDRVVVCIHWGVPWAYLPENQGPLAEYQQPLGRRLVEAGADVVVGTHPHCMHPVERWQGGLIIYSAGNFLFNTADITTPETYFALPYRTARLFTGPWFDSAVFRVELPATGPAELQLVPIILDGEGEPHLAADNAAERILSAVERMSQEIDPAVRIDADGFVRFRAG